MNSTKSNNNTLIIKNIGLAIYAELELQQKPTPTPEGWAFKTGLQIEQIKYGYANSQVQRVYEMNLAYRDLRRQMNNN